MAKTETVLVGHKKEHIKSRKVNLINYFFFSFLI